VTTPTELQALSRDDIISELPELGVGSFKPNYNIVFAKDGKQIGELDFNGDKMVFRGEADESAKVFFDWVAQYFAQRLQDERNAGLKEAADDEVTTLRQQLADMTAAKEEAEKALQQIATLEVSINGHNINAQEYMRDIAIKALEDTK